MRFRPQREIDSHGREDRGTASLTGAKGSEQSVTAKNPRAWSKGVLALHLAASVVVPCILVAGIDVLAHSFEVYIPGIHPYVAFGLLALPGFLLLARVVGRRVLIIAPFYFVGMYYVLRGFELLFVGNVYDLWL